MRIAFCLEEERGALRLFLRALRRLPLEMSWEAAVWTPGATEVRLARRLRDRVHVLGPRQATPEELIAGADVLCAASGGPRPAPGLLRKALASRAVPVASQLPLYRELVGDGERGLLFPPGDAFTLAGQLQRLIAEPGLRVDLWSAPGRRRSRLGRGGRPGRGDLPARSARAATTRAASPPCGAGSRRSSIHVDLHMHTDHSPDCATPVEVLLATAKERGLGAIAITDHNEISGALAAREVAEEMGGMKVIVAEEVKTAEQGEVIGLFLEEKIPRGMTMERRSPRSAARAGWSTSRTPSTASTRSPTTSTCSTWSRRSTSSRCSTRGSR